MHRAGPLALLWLTILAVVAPEVLAQAGGGSSGFSGGGGGGGGGGSGGGFSGGGDTGDDSGGTAGPFEIAFFALIVLAVFVVPVLRRRFAERRANHVSRAERAARRARHERVSTASAEAAEEDPIFAAEAVTAQAAELYVEIQEAWSDQDETALERMLGRDLLVEWCLRLADFKRKGWTNTVEILRGPEVEYVGLVNREGVEEDRVTVIVSAKLRSVVRARFGEIITRDVDFDGDGAIEVCEYWTLARDGDRWRLVSIEQRREGAHHLGAEIVTAPWSDDARLSDASLVELASADAPPAGTNISELVAVEFDGSAHEHAMDLALADPRCAPDVLEVAARRAVQAWAEAVDGDDGALSSIAAPEAVRALLYPPGSTGARVVVRGPTLLRLAIVALHVEADPPRMVVEAELRGRRYVEDRDTAAVLDGDKDAETTFTERWTFALQGPPQSPWQLVAAGDPTLA